ncbi:Coiled-coil domain-containing protein 19, mitochondrial [Tetrabaena socialis]|uniref:Cilia- and flagella-associated protein 45 n=1 Tax=Tetrabaena socialis TaxID=47790 RepID=A0A2J8A844_9CHLO|nr:Coiled-coil domain-containing protein 19, mitochondrial [Tetrabaena socialis]|eukprot:PNH08697.1 Coiled-coil domain-containing protein 19, mitochondrial [Tetrabaena socialis]
MPPQTPPRTGYKSGKATFVDESLFGGSKPHKVDTLDTASQLKLTVPAHTISSKDRDVVTLTKGDLTRMLKASPIMSAEEAAAAKREAEAKREQLQAVSKARKEKMMKLEEEAKKQAPPTETDILQRQLNDATRSRATHMLLEQKDPVKNMNQMMLYSKCVTIRDAQIEEKKQMLAEEEEEQRRLDLMMEIERVKALEQYEARERQRLDERRRGAAVLNEQINERQRERTRQEELRDQERMQMLKEMERLKEEEMQAQIEKRLQAKFLMEEVATANSEQIRRKEQMKVREKDEDLRIAEYIVQKELREQSLTAEKERIAREKEQEVARLRAMQERAADKQAELDELRARRYQEAKEREWRTKERAHVERQTAMQHELANARTAQQAAKIKQKAEVAQLEHGEFMRVLDVNRQKEYEDLQQTVNSMTLNHKYKEELLAQIQANEERRKRERQAYLEDGARLREAADKEKQLLAQIKERKLGELEGAGVPGKYRAELEKMKIQFR